MEAIEKELQAKFVDTYLHTFKYLGDAMSVGAEEHQISFEAYLLLHMIGEHDAQLTMAQIADIRGVSRSAIARQINTLLKKKFIQQLVNFDDRRVRYLKITSEGMAVDENITERNDAEFTRWLNVFGVNEAKAALGYVENFNDRLSEMGLAGFDALHDKRHSQRSGKTFA
ncbi:MarR family winged helix-turn-helix transcriptional regulator [Levilactobacillus bambusae]|uniref:MarR family transcriptional regulator n=1 Tax=Levilactobacillus bambusae TaxID=2024736 RepID=A0A2V1N010_9LACO|nr:MarR family transcriptional regulator [Levilactobacillus bambusae]PWF99754.1 MarR family transcriptional regulator [Levilactobacillus bambusae]